MKSNSSKSGGREKEGTLTLKQLGTSVGKLKWILFGERVRNAWDVLTGKVTLLPFPFEKLGIGKEIDDIVKKKMGHKTLLEIRRQTNKFWLLGLRHKAYSNQKMMYVVRKIVGLL